MHSAWSGLAWRVQVPPSVNRYGHGESDPDAAYAALIVDCVAIGLLLWQSVFRSCAEQRLVLERLSYRNLSVGTRYYMYESCGFLSQQPYICSILSFMLLSQHNSTVT